MKTWKKVITLIVLILSSALTCFACGKNSKYDNMKIEFVSCKDYADNDIQNNTVVFSSDSSDASKNHFTLMLKVTGVDSKVDRRIEFSVDNPKVIMPNGGKYYESLGVTEAYFDIVGDGETIIRAKTIEGNKTFDYAIKVSVPIQSFEVKNNLIPIIRNSSIDLSDTDKYISFFPSNTTQREISYKAIEINEIDRGEVDKINAKLSINPRVIDTTDLKDITSFILEITSVYDSSLTQQTIVNILDKMDTSEFIFEEIIPSDEDPETHYNQLTVRTNELTNERTYSLMLGLNNDTEHAKFSSSIIELKGLNSSSGETYELNSIVNNFKKFESLDGAISAEDYRFSKYSVRIKGLKEDGFVEGLGNELMITKLPNNQFLFARSSSPAVDKVYTITFVVDYNTFEGMFETIEIPVQVTMKMFPKDIFLFASESDMKSGRDNHNPNVKSLGDNQIIAYKKGRMPVWVDVWSDSNSLERQQVKITCDNENIVIEDNNGRRIDTITGGEIFYIRQQENSPEITGEVNLTFTSAVYSEISKTVKISCVKDDTQVIFDNTTIYLNPANYSDQTSSVNIESIDLIAEGYLRFTGLPTKEGTEDQDYSTVNVHVENTTFFDFEKDINNNTLCFRNIKNKLGSVNVTVTLPNGESATRVFKVAYNFEDPSFLSIQFEDFENYDTDSLSSTLKERVDDYGFKMSDYSYKFVGVKSDEVASKTRKTKLLIGKTYSYYFLLGNAGMAQTYYDLSGILKTVSITSSNSSCVSIEGNLIKVKDYSDTPVTLNFVYRPMEGNNLQENICISIKVYFEKPITSIYTEQNNYDIYDFSTVNQNVTIGNTSETYVSKYAIKTIQLHFNPTNAISPSNVDWRVGAVGANGYYSMSDDTKDANGKIIRTFIIDGTDGKGTVSLEFMDENCLSAKLTVTNIPGNTLRFNIYIFATQHYLGENGIEIASSISTIASINVSKATRVGGISAKLFNNRISFDIRNMSYDQDSKMFTQNNTAKFEYTLNPVNVDGRVSGTGILIKDVSYQLDSSDISLDEVALQKGIVKLTVNRISGTYENNPKYTLLLTAKDGGTPTKIIISIADGKNIPFEIGSVQDLRDIADLTKYSKALESNYVLTKNIDLRGENWRPIGTLDNPFKGTLSGRYYIDEEQTNYRDYSIVGLNIKVDNSGTQCETKLENTNSYISMYGLFGCISEKAIIKNLRVYSYSINITTYLTIDNTSNSAYLNEYVGVLVAYNKGKIIDCEIDDGNLHTLSGAQIAKNSNSTLGIFYSQKCSVNSFPLYSSVGGVTGRNSGTIQGTKFKGFVSFDSSNGNKYVRSGGLAGVNDGEIIGKSENFVVSNGLEEFDVVSVINAHKDSSLLSAKNSIGGAVGYNTNKVSNLSVRTFVFGDTTSQEIKIDCGVGGLIGYNRGNVIGNTVVPVVIGNVNVGGLIGSSTNDSSSANYEFKVLDEMNISSNKVQILDFKDIYSYMNTAVKGGFNVGGLIGFYNNSQDNTLNSNIDRSQDSEKYARYTVIKYTNALSYNSVTSYFGRTTNNFDSNYSYDISNNPNGLYFGDIVVTDTNSDTTTYVGGFIGSANNALISSGYSNLSIVFSTREARYSFGNTNNDFIIGGTFVGGFVGSIRGVSSVFNTQVFGNIYNKNASLSVNSDKNYAGSFFGDVSRLNDYLFKDGEKTFTLNILEIWTSNVTFTNNNDKKISMVIPNSIDETATKIKNTYNDLLDVKSLLSNQYLYGLTMVDITNNLTLNFANLISSYSIVTITENHSGTMQTKELSRIYGQDRLIYNTGSFGVAFMYDGDVYLSTKTYIEVPSVVGYNSYALGSTINLYLSINVKDNNNLNPTSYTKELGTKIITLDDLKVALDLSNYEITDTEEISKLGTSVSYYSDLYERKYQYSDETKTITTKVYSNLVSKFMPTSAFSKSNSSWEGTITDESLLVPQAFGNFDIIRNADKNPVALSGLYVSTNKNETGIDERPLGDGTNYLDKLNNSLRYYNPKIHSGYPVAIAKNPTFTQNNDNYINLIIIFKPEIIEINVGNVLSDVNYVNTWISAVETANKLNPENKTIFYYELKFADKNSNLFEYNKMPWEYKNGQKVIDFDKNGIYTSIDQMYTDYVMEEINNKNIHSLSDVLKISIQPPFLQNGMIKFTSSNPNVAVIRIIDDKAYIETKSTGVVEFTISSLYNSDIKTSFKVNIINAVNTFEMYENQANSKEINLNDKITVIKNEDLATTIYSKLNGSFDIQNEYLKTYASSDLKLTLNNAVNSESTYGIRYIYLNSGADILFDNDNVEINTIKINGKKFAPASFADIYGKTGYYYYVDDDSMMTKITGVETTTESIRLLAVPYVNHGHERTYLFDFANMSYNIQNLVVSSGNSLCKLLTIDVVEGVYDISSTPEVTFKPVNSQIIDIEVKTDNENSQLFVNISANSKELELYSDLEKSTSLTKPNLENIFKLNLDAYELKQDFDVIYFDKMYIKNLGALQVRDNSGKLTSIKYSVKIGVANKYLFDSGLNNEYNIKFTVVNYEKQVLTSETKVTIERQNIDNTMIKHFAGVDEFTENVTEYNLNDYYESNSLVTGYPGLLQIDVFPKYANIDYIEIISSESGGRYVSLEQLVAKYDRTNTYFDGYYHTYTQDRQIILSGRGIRMGKYSNTYNDGSDNYYFDGTFYARTVVPNLPLGSVDFTLTINCYLDGKIIATNQIVINVTKRPTVDLNIKGENFGVIALGRELEVTAETNTQIVWSTDESEVNYEQVMTAKEPVYNAETKAYDIKVKSIHDLGGFDEALKLVGKNIVLKATVSIIIKGRVYSTSDSIPIKLALFTIDEVAVKYVENDNFQGVFNQPYDLMGYISKATYDLDYDKDADVSKKISTIISNYSNLLSRADKNSFKILSNGYWSVLTDEPNQKSDFWIERRGDYYVIKNNMRYTSSSLKLDINVQYTTMSNDAEFGIIINPRSYTNNDFIINRNKQFGFNFIRLSNEEYPEPIYTQAELSNMEEGGYYILLSDITLNNWTPINTAIASLDGNGYVISINKDSFYDTTIQAPAEGETSSEKLSLGIFSEISENTIIKNLTIEMLPSNGVISDVITSSSSDIDIPVQ